MTRSHRARLDKLSREELYGLLWDVEAGLMGKLAAHGAAWSSLRAKVVELRKTASHKWRTDRGDAIDEVLAILDEYAERGE